MSSFGCGGQFSGSSMPLESVSTAKAEDAVYSRRAARGCFMGGAG